MYGEKALSAYLRIHVVAASTVRMVHCIQLSKVGSSRFLLNFTNNSDSFNVNLVTKPISQFKIENENKLLIFYFDPQNNAGYEQNRILLAMMTMNLT